MKHVKVQLTKELYELLQKEAEARGVHPSNLLSDIVIEHFMKRKSESQEA